MSSWANDPSRVSILRSNSSGLIVGLPLSTYSQEMLFSPKDTLVGVAARDWLVGVLGGVARGPWFVRRRLVPAGRTELLSNDRTLQ